MPRIEGVSSSSRVRCILFRPRPTSVARWLLGRRIGAPICLTTIFYVMISGLRNLGRGISRRVGARQDVRDLLAPPLRDHARALLMHQPVDGGAHHVVGVLAAERLGYHVVRSEEHTSELQSRENLVC